MVLYQNRQQWSNKREFFENNFILKCIKLQSKYLWQIMKEEKQGSFLCLIVVGKPYAYRKGLSLVLVSQRERFTPSNSFKPAKSLKIM